MAKIVMLVHEENGRFGASFPDVPGCTTASRNLDNLLAKAPEVLAFHVEAMVKDGLATPTIRSLAALRSDPVFREDAADATVVLLDFDPPGRTVRVNITVDESTLRRIDRAAEAAGESRSGFLVAAARDRIASAA